jgi:hypothetical protein
MVYGHQHNATAAVVKNWSADQHKQTFKEKCDLCDVMHHNSMLTAYQVYFSPVKVVAHVYKNFGYSFTNIRLLAAGGRAPPRCQS